MKADPMADLNSRIAKLEKLTLSDKISELTARVKGAEFNYSYVNESESNSYAHGNIALADTLKDLLADVVAFAHRAQGHHWNVEGANFPEYHRLFGKIYEDVNGSVDPLAESIRVLGHVAPFDIADFAMNTDIENRPLKDAMCQTLSYDLSIGNGILIDKLKQAFEIANSSNQQGIADLIAGRIEAHQKWQWQLMVAIAPHYEESYGEGHEYQDGEDAYIVYETVFADLNKSGVLEAVVASVESTDELVESFDAVMQFAEFSPAQRKNLAKKGEALPDGAYPIRNEGDLKNAIKAFGRAKSSERGEVKKHIIKRARALKKSDLIPETWVKKSMTASADLDRMREKLAEFGNLGAVSETDPKKASSGIATSQLPLELSNEEFEAFASSVDAELEKLVKKVVPVSEQEIDRAISEVDQPTPAPAPQTQAPQDETKAPAEGQEIVAPSGEVNVEVEETPMGEDGKFVPGKTQPRDVQGRFRLVLARLRQDLGTSGNQDVIDKIAEAENLIGNVGNYAGAVKSASELISTIDRLDSGALNAKSVENVRATTTELGRTIANLPLPFDNQATKVRFSDLPATLKSLAKDLITRVEDKIGKEEADIATKELRGFMSGNDVYNQGEVSSQFNRLLRLLT
jgi:starvation-inducible DNA-binding protein